MLRAVADKTGGGFPGSFTTLTVSGVSSITANSASAALTVTQTGSGNAFVVEDSASDTTPFVIDSAGNVGIGVSPATKLDLYNTSTASTIAQVRNDSVSLQIQAGNNFTYINTFTDDPMLFGTNNAVRMQINSAGSVGIGITPASTSILTVAASTTAVSSLNIPHGAAPTSPVNGDMWTTTAGLFIRINGATVGPLS